MSRRATHWADVMGVSSQFLSIPKSLSAVWVLFIENSRILTTLVVIERTSTIILEGTLCSHNQRHSLTYHHHHWSAISSWRSAINSWRSAISYLTLRPNITWRSAESIAPRSAPYTADAQPNMSWGSVQHKDFKRTHRPDAQLTICWRSAMSLSVRLPTAQGCPGKIAMSWIH